MHTLALEFPVDGSQEQERNHYIGQVYLAEASVRSFPCVIRPVK